VAIFQSLKALAFLGDTPSSGICQHGSAFCNALTWTSWRLTCVDTALPRQINRMDGTFTATARAWRFRGIQVFAQRFFDFVQDFHQLIITFP